jgi:hypothetical protein
MNTCDYTGSLCEFAGVQIKGAMEECSAVFPEQCPEKARQEKEWEKSNYEEKGDRS